MNKKLTSDKEKPKNYNGTQLQKCGKQKSTFKNKNQSSKRTKSNFKS